MKKPLKFRIKKRPFRKTPGNWQTQGKSRKSKRKLERKPKIVEKLGAQELRAYMRETKTRQLEKIITDVKSKDWLTRRQTAFNLWSVMNAQNVWGLSTREQNELNYHCVRSLIALTSDRHPSVSGTAQNILKRLLEGEEPQTQWVSRNSKVKEIIIRKLKR